MQILFNTTKINTQRNNQFGKNIYPCPSFKMKMSELKGIDQFVARKYKINPQPIKTLQEFQKKCKSFVEDIAQKAKEGNFGGRQQETQVQRKAMIKDWYDYVVKENGAYTGAMALMILAGITKGLKPDEDNLLPVLNKGVLADTVTKIEDEIKGLKPNEEAQINFDKQYRLNLQKRIFREEKALDENLNGWIVIPSKKHDKKNFKANVDKLKMLSHDNWCTKSFNAEPYLEKGDFHVYMEKGKPKLGVRFLGDEIQEIQGELNNSRIPVKYGDIAKEYINKYTLSFNAENELNILEKTKAKIKEIQKEFPNGVNNYPVEEIFKKFGIECKRDKSPFSEILVKLGLKSKAEGNLIISHYSTMVDYDISFSDIGIDENRLIKNVKRIEKRADFSTSQITNLDNLESIGECAYFENSQITSLGNLKSIGGDAVFEHSQITSLGNLQSIGGSATFMNSKIASLGKLQSIGETAFFNHSRITSLGNLQSIGKMVDFRESQVTNLGNLKSIGDSAFIKGSKLTPEDFASIKVGFKIM